ncbi:hypothetical protein [Floridanema evergladense]|uniref:Uncharacterized protein n=1 Tax=Floridaenema evergladense BLCC-F167 TaxID=3153639 RepID=A0ABV4WME6_9CYAN
MEPEKLINSFLKVWDVNPEIFEKTGAIAGLDSMQKDIEKINQESLEDIAKRIEDLCDDYEGLAEAILAANRKPKPKKSKDTNLENILENRYPEIYKALREKIEKSEQK